jgi:quercetin dioxygenase-like cupin family protein
MRTRVTSLVISVGAVALAGLTAVAVHSQDGASMDPRAKYPENYRVLFEDARVRVLDFRLKQGAKEDFHAHPANVAVFLGEFKIRFTLPDGRTALRDAHPGDVAYSSSAVTHASENIGTTDAHGILIELK